MQTSDVVTKHAAPGSKTLAQRAKRWGIIAGACLSGLLGAYVTGRLQTAGRIDEADKELAGAVQARQAMATALEAAGNRGNELEARRLLHLSLLALDKRNFGIAQQRIDQAATLLLSARTAGVQSLSSELFALKLAASDDLEGQRSKVLGLAERFDLALEFRGNDSAHK